MAIDSYLSQILSLTEQKNVKISLAESCTGGLLSSLLTDIPGSSNFFSGCIVSYSNQSKMDLLKVQESTLKKFGAVSVETAKEMALGALECFKSDLSLSLTGIAGPQGNSKDKPVGMLAIGQATASSADAQVFYFSGDRQQLKEEFCRQALILLVDLLEKKL